MNIFHVGLDHFLGLGALLFGIGLYGLVTRKNELSWIIGILLVFSSTIICLAAFSRYQVTAYEGEILPVFIIIIVSIQTSVTALLAIRKYRQFSDSKKIKTGKRSIK